MAEMLSLSLSMALTAFSLALRRDVAISLRNIAGAQPSFFSILIMCKMRHLCQDNLKLSLPESRK